MHKTLKHKFTSFHNLNSDKGLTRINKLKWLLYNYLNNRYPNSFLDKSLQLSNKTINIDKPWSKISSVSSPARRLCDSFWHNLPWSKISKVLGGSVKALEVGCGSGKYGKLLETQLGKSLNEYIGIDIKSNEKWKDYNNKNLEFVIGNSNSIINYLPNSNLIITQSALEHFDEDLAYFFQVSELIMNSNSPVIQIHLMPSAACLYNQLWHGVRQYTPRNISKITKLFDKNTIKTLYSLGGNNSNKVHRKFVLFPLLRGIGDQRFNNTKLYLESLKKAIDKDQNKLRLNNATFYALIMQSNISENIIDLD